jgi:hypothetical protein
VRRLRKPPSTAIAEPVTNDAAGRNALFQREQRFGAHPGMIGLRYRDAAQSLEEHVTRKIVAIATALLAAPALFASTAEACISCEYTPEVVRGSQTSDAPAHYARERVYAVEREHIARPAKRIVRSEPVARTVDTAETAPVKTEAKNENSSISLTSTTVAVTETAKVAPKAARSENSSISLASTEAAATAKAPVVETVKEAAAKPVDCKKFFPSVGITLSVPCE